MYTGDPYPLTDSKHHLWRAWCSECGEPLRVSANVLFRDDGSIRPLLCDTCFPHTPPAGHNMFKDDMSPWQENAVRYMEDGS